MAKILIVDDRVTNRELMLTLLGYAGHQLFEAQEGEEGLAIARAEYPDLIITDIMMPKMDGYEFARQVRADASIKDTQIIFYTSSYIVAETRRLANSCGVSTVIGKPIEPELFLKKIEEALNTRPSLTNLPVSEEFHREHMRVLTDTLVNKVELLEAEIQERKQIESILQANELRFRSLIENGLDSISLLTAEGKLLWESPSANRMLGYEHNEFIGKNIFELVHPEDIERIALQFKDLLSKPRTVRRESFRLRHASGDWRWVECIGTNLLSEPSVSAIVINYRDITERKQAEQALRNSEEKYRAVVENQREFIVRWKPDGTRTFANEAYLRYFGLTSQEALSTHFMPLVAKEDRQAIEEKILRLTSGKVSSETDIHRVIKPDGSMAWNEWTDQAIYDDTGNIIEFQSIGRDITERKQSEESLRLVERRSQALIEKAPDGIVLIRTDGMMEFASPSAKQIFGYEEESVVGLNPAELTHPEDLNMVFAALSDIIQDPSLTPTLQYRFLHKNGNWLWVESTFTNLQDDASVNAIVINFHDITKQKQAEETNQRQLKHLQALRSIDIAISNSFDLKLSLDILLSAALSELEISAASILLFDPVMSTLEYKAGKGFYSIGITHTNIRLGEGFAGESALENRTIYIPSLAHAKEKFIRADLLKDEGFVSYYGIPLVAKGKLKGVLEVFHRTELRPTKDWTDFFETLAGQAAIAIDNAQLFENLQRSNFELERRVAERTAELNKTNLELEHANRTKDEFLANMSHELRTPLNSILGLSESMLEQYRDTLSENQQKSLQIIESSGRHLLDLINDVLDLAKIEAGKFDYYPQLIHVNDLCKSSLIFVKMQAMKKGITLTYEIEDTISDFSADPRRLKQILVNLLTNAVKFTPNDGYVTLKVNVKQDVIQFSVIDTGIGIAPEDLRRLFTPFVQVESSLNRHFEGTGLGLALVHKLTDLHGGSVEVESEVGKGSRFTIKLPYQGSVLGQAVEAEKSISHSVDGEAGFQPKIESKNQKILLVEDNQSNILTIGEYLENHGYEIVIANDGVQAIEKANEINPNIILMDIQMPVMDGLEAIRRLRTDVRFAKTPIIALTALAMPGDRERCLEAGANEYMTKPVSLKGLRKIIESFLNSQK